jgi:hypothetical protein
MKKAVIYSADITSNQYIPVLTIREDFTFDGDQNLQKRVEHWITLRRELTRFKSNQLFKMLARSFTTGYFITLIEDDIDD